MRIWCVVFNPSYTATVAGGPIPLENVSITRSLDRLARLSTKIAGNDLRALQHITARCVVEVYCQPITPPHLPAIPARLLGVFIVDNTAKTIEAKEVKYDFQATSLMLQLKDTLTLPGLAYDNATIEDIFNSVNGLATLAGWTADVEAGISANTTSVRFDGTSIFKSMQSVTEIQGLHLRHTTGTVVEVGQFGAANGYVLQYIEGDTGGLFNYDSMNLLIESMEIVEDAAGDFYNYVLGFGAGQGDARLTLQKSDRAGIVTVNDGSRDHYIIKDDASIATYGTIQRMVQIKKLAPVGTSEPQQINAANALYDGLYENLQRHKEPLAKYRVTVRNVQNTIQPGDKLRIIYDGVVHKDGLSAPYKWLTLNDDFWVMSVTENVGANGVQLQLEIANVDRYQQSAAEIIVGMVESIEVNNIGVQPYPVSYPWVLSPQPIDTSTPIEFTFPIFENVLKLVSVRAYLERRVWTAVSGAAGGIHKHKVATHLTTDFEYAPVTVNPVTGIGTATLTKAQYRYAIDTTVPGGTYNMYIVVDTGTIDDWYTEGASDSHTHPFSTVQKDSLLPEDCSLVVNGALVSSTLFPTSGGSDIEEIDITEEVLNKAGGFRGFHDVAIDCGTNRGDIGITIFIEVEIGTVRA